ncbi:uncharacterized protein LOC141606944 [Silene latifolia]|uniref:uncharacterized protein LOC141606944 n=1 Tax=Silene latifolia TaxID=37657 RepID=UPI003D785F64
METMIRDRELAKIRSKCGYSSGLCLSSRGRSGGLGFWWKNIDAELISYDKNHVMVEVKNASGEPEWRAVGIYGWPDAESKHLTWRMIRSLRRSSTIPIILFGDFNEIISLNEKEGGKDRREAQMDAFREALDDCALLDLGYRGSIFTWKRGNSPETLIRERLDRAVATMEWREMYPSATTFVYPLYASDHAAILIKEEGNQGEVGSRQRSFKFEPLWLSDAECGHVVKQAWEDGQGHDVEDRVKSCATKLQGG